MTKWYHVGKYNTEINRCRTVDAHRETEHFIFHYISGGRELREKKTTNYGRWIEGEEAARVALELKAGAELIKKERRNKAAAAVELFDALWIAVEHNALHFGENHNTVIAGRAALKKAMGEQ